MPTNLPPTIYLPYHAIKDVIQRGKRADQPLATLVVPGTLYCVTDEGRRVERSTGAVWELYASGGPLGAVFPYRADTTSQTAGDPGAGRMRWNHVTQGLATAIYFDWLTVNDIDVHTMFLLMTPPGRFLVQDADLAVTYQIWELTALGINHPDWFEVPCALVATGGSGVFTHNQQLAVIR